MAGQASQMTLKEARAMQERASISTSSNCGGGGMNSSTMHKEKKAPAEHSSMGKEE